MVGRKKLLADCGRTGSRQYLLGTVVHFYRRMQTGASILYTPLVPPEFNAAEFVFSKLKAVTRKENLQRTVKKLNIHVLTRSKKKLAKD